MSVRVEFYGAFTPTISLSIAIAIAWKTVIIMF